MEVPQPRRVYKGVQIKCGLRHCVTWKMSLHRGEEGESQFEQVYRKTQYWNRKRLFIFFLFLNKLKQTN